MISDQLPIAVSIIVPVYQGREHFELLLNDLRHQTLRNIEIILIDDCGDDGSFEYALKAAEQDPRIVCLRNAVNVGQGICRNKGIDIARGEYLAFADADDIICHDYYEKLYTKAKLANYKVVKGNRIAVYPDGRHQYSRLNAFITTKLKSNIPLHCAFTWEHQTAIFRRDYILQCGARNAEGRRDQDTAFLLWALYDVKPEEFNFVPEAVYYYRKHGGAVTANINYTYMVELMKSFAFKLNFLKLRECDKHTLSSIIYQAEDRFTGRLCAALQNDKETEDVSWLSLIRDMRAMLVDFAGRHPFNTQLEFTRMALDGNISDEQMLKHCRNHAATACVVGFSPKCFDEITPGELEHDSVHIATVANESNIVSCIVLLQSVKSSKRASSHYTIHVFTDTLSQMWMEVLNRLQTEDFEIQVYEEVDMSLFMSKQSSWSLADVTLLFLPSKLPHLDKVLFCPPCAVVKADLIDVYSHAMGDACLASSLTVTTEGPVQQYGGLLLLNLQALREKELSVHAREHAEKLHDVLTQNDRMPLHPRYGLHIDQVSRFMDGSTSIDLYNKCVSGCSYTNACELVKDAQVVIYPYNQQQCLCRTDGFCQVWRRYLMESPASFMLESIALSLPDKSCSANPKKIKQATPNSQPPQNQDKSGVNKIQQKDIPYKKEFRVFGVPVWSKNTKTGKCVYRLFGIRVRHKKIK